MSRNNIKSQKYNPLKSLGSFDEKEEEDSALYLLEGLKDLLKKTNSEKRQVKKRQHSSNSDYYEETDDYCEQEEKERVERERVYLHEEHKHIQKVHKELCDINNKLQHESKRLRLWEEELEERESRLNDVEKELSEYAGSIEDIIKKKSQKQHDKLEEEFELKFKELANENKKLRNSFKIMKKANDTYKAAAESNEEKMKCYEQKQTSMQNRIANLQRKIEILNQQLKEQSISPTFYTSKERRILETNNTTHKKSKEDLNSPFFEMFGNLLQWVSEVHLKQSVINILKSDKISNGEHDISTELTNEKCMKIIISLPTILSQVSTLDDTLQLSFLQFIYWSIFHAHLTQSSQKFSHSATYRRIGEELYQGKTIKSKDAFFKSDDPQIRLLSSLIVLYTITQADILANAFHRVNTDLRQDHSKSHFIQYRGTFILHPLFKLTNKTNLSNTTDILMVMATESPFLQAFLESLSTVEWIQAIVTIMRSCQEDTKLMEKLSLLLQRLSKLKANKPILEALQLKTIVSEFLRTCSPDAEFLQLNLRSVLFNIESSKSGKDKL